MSGTDLAMLLLASRLVRPGYDPDEYVDRVVPAGSARDVMRSILRQDVLVRGEPVVEVPVTMWVPQADVMRLVLAWTGKDDDVVLAAEKAMRARVGGDDDGGRELEVGVDREQGTAIDAVRTTLQDIREASRAQPKPSLAEVATTEVRAVHHAAAIGGLFQRVEHVRGLDRLPVSLIVSVPLTVVQRFAAAWTGRDDDVVLAAEKAVRGRLAEVYPEPVDEGIEWAVDRDVEKVLEALRDQAVLPWR